MTSSALNPASHTKLALLPAPLVSDTLPLPPAFAPALAPPAPPTPPIAVPPLPAMPAHGFERRHHLATARYRHGWIGVTVKCPQ